VGKPFALEELLGRIQALLRRSRWMPPATIVDETRYRFGANTVDLTTGIAHTAKGELRLTSLELRLLRYLIDHAGSTLGRNALLRDVWDVADPDRVRTRSVDTFIARLRKYFEEDPGKPMHILTDHGTGYRQPGRLPASPEPATARRRLSRGSDQAAGVRTNAMH